MAIEPAGRQSRRREQKHYDGKVLTKSERQRSQLNNTWVVQTLAHLTYAVLRPPPFNFEASTSKQKMRRFCFWETLLHIPMRQGCRLPRPTYVISTSSASLNRFVPYRTRATAGTSRRTKGKHSLACVACAQKPCSIRGDDHARPLAINGEGHRGVAILLSVRSCAWCPCSRKQKEQRCTEMDACIPLQSHR